MNPYQIKGLPIDQFAALFGRDDADLAKCNAVRVTADHKPGYPCRVTLEDAEPGETLLLINYEDHRVASPYRHSYAIYVRENAIESASLRGKLPQVFANRPIALRAFDGDGMLRGATLALANDVDDKIAQLFADPTIAYLHAHNAAHGCFAARIDRS